MMTTLVLCFVATTALTAPIESTAPAHTCIQIDPTSESLIVTPRTGFFFNDIGDCPTCQATLIRAVTPVATAYTTALVGDSDASGASDSGSVPLIPGGDLEVWEQIVDKDGNLVGEDPGSSGEETTPATPKEETESDPAEPNTVLLPSRVITNGVEYDNRELAEMANECLENVITSTEEGPAIVYNFRITDLSWNEDDTFNLTFTVSNPDDTALIRQGTILVVNRVNPDQTREGIFYGSANGEPTNTFDFTHIPTYGEKTMLLSVSLEPPEAEVAAAVAEPEEAQEAVVAEEILVDEIDLNVPIVDVINSADLVGDAIEVELIAAQDAAEALLQDLTSDDEILDIPIPTR